jgi:hypothetical protein
VTPISLSEDVPGSGFSFRRVVRVKTLAALQYPDDEGVTDFSVLDIEELTDADVDRYSHAAVVVREVMEGGLSAHLNESLFQFESLLAQLNEARDRNGAFATSLSFGTRWNRTCLYALFAFASGVYSYRERSKQKPNACPTPMKR